MESYFSYSSYWRAFYVSNRRVTPVDVLIKDTLNMLSLNNYKCKAVNYRNVLPISTYKHFFVLSR